MCQFHPVTHPVPSLGRLQRLPARTGLLHRRRRHASWRGRIHRLQEEPGPVLLDSAVQEELRRGRQHEHHNADGVSRPRCVGLWRKRASEWTKR